MHPNSSVLLAAASLVAALASPARGDPPPAARLTPEREALIWRVTKNCGVNSLYVLLGAHGRETEYEPLMADLEARKTGSENSLADLRAAAADRGLECRVGKATLEGLRSLPKPVIVHVEDGGTTSGHFMVVVDVRPDAVDLIEGTTGSEVTLSDREFTQAWTGYVLYVPPPWYAAIPWWAFALAAAAVGGTAGLGLTRAVRRGPTQFSKTPNRTTP